MTKKLYIIIVTSAALLTLSSCGGRLGSYREVASLQIVQTIGVDIGGEQAVVSISTGTVGDKPPTLISHSAPSIVTGFDMLQDHSAQENLFFAHTNHILVGEDTARRSIGTVIGLVNRSTQMRTKIPLFVVKGELASTLVTGTGDGSYDITDVLHSLKQDVELQSESHVYTCGEITRSLTECGAALVCAVECESSEGVIFSGGGGLSAVPAGFAVIKEAKLVTFLTPDQSRATNLLMNNVRSGYAIVDDPEGNRVTLNVLTGKTEFTPVYGGDGGLEKILVHSALEMGVVELESPGDIENDEYRRALEESKRGQVLGWIEEVLDISQETGADFLGIGRLLLKSDPVAFEGIREDWEETLKTVEFEAGAEVLITTTYDISSSPADDGSGRGGVA